MPGATIQRMTRTVRYLLVGLLIACVCSSSISAEYQGCNITKECCLTYLNSTECDVALKVTVNSSVKAIEEGDEVTLTCLHNIPDLNMSYAWFKNDKQMGPHEKTLLIEKVLTSSNGKYKCRVNTTCGSCESQPFDINIKNNGILIIVICGVSALVLVIIMGVAMKIKLKKDQAQHQERRRQREQERNAQGAGQIPFPRGY